MLDLSTTVEAINEALDQVEGDLRTTDPREPRYGELRQERAALLGALAHEHVADRLDTIIGLVFDDGRTINVDTRGSS